MFALTTTPESDNQKNAAKDRPNKSETPLVGFGFELGEFLR